MVPQIKLNEKYGLHQQNDFNMISYFNQSKGQVIDLDISYVNELSEISDNKLKQHLTSCYDHNRISALRQPPMRRSEKV